VALKVKGAGWKKSIPFARHQRYFVPGQDHQVARAKGDIQLSESTQEGIGGNPSNKRWAEKEERIGVQKVLRGFCMGQSWYLQLRRDHAMIGLQHFIRRSFPPTGLGLNGDEATSLRAKNALHFTRAFSPLALPRRKTHGRKKEKQQKKTQ